MISNNDATPTVKGLPIFGSAFDMRRDPLGLLAEVRRRHGDLAQMWLGPYRVYLAAHPDYVRHVLQRNSDNYLKEGYEHIGVIGRGLLASEGELWRRQRRVIQPAFHKERLQGMAKAMTDTTGEMLSRWRTRIQREDVGTLDVSEEMSRLTLRIVSQTLVGADLGSDEAGEIAHALGFALRDGFTRVGRFVALPLGVPTPKNRRHLKAIRVLDRLVYSLVDRRLANSEARDDLLSMLIEARDPETGEGMGREQIRDEVMTMLTAGHETVARTLIWTFYQLDRNPEAAVKLREELDGTLGGRAPTFEDYASELPYARMVLQETMRLFPPVWGLARRARGDDEIGGYRVPKGSRVIVSQYVTHRHPDFWEEPERFDPGRFSSEGSEGRSKYAYFPFGGGPRQCVGQSFAMMEATLVIAMVSQRFALSLDPGHQVEVEPSFTLGLRGGLPMVARELD